MPTINSNLIPTVTPGNLFQKFISDASISVRWLTARDPVYYEALNRPLADLTMRQLVIAKTVDQINMNMGYVSLFPFVIQPQVESGPNIANIPVRIFWDMHVSLPAKWAKVRLSRVDRLDGENSSSADYSGTLRFIFVGNESDEGSEANVETALFYVDYEIASELTFQLTSVTAITSGAGIVGYSNMIPVGEANTIGGQIIFRTQSFDDSNFTAFLELVAPGSSTESYNIVNTNGTNTSDDYSLSALTSGTGLLVSSATNAITNLESDPLNWIEAFNYPFSTNSTMESEDSNVSIPVGMFQEFNITAPAGDAGFNDNTGTTFPVWISRLERDGTDLILYFSTYNVTSVPDSANPIEFASLTLNRTMIGGQTVVITPASDLLLGVGNTNIALFQQHFGRGHVVLSRKWDITGGVIDSLFDSLPEISGGSNVTSFSKEATRIGAYGISRVPKYTPTQGESAALKGSSARLATPKHPSDTNRFVTELDEGLGDTIDLEAQPGITHHDALPRYGNMATRVHKAFRLILDQDVITGSTFYDDHVLPRINLLLGRAPIFGDAWYNGSRWMTYTGEAWVD